MGVAQRLVSVPVRMRLRYWPIMGVLVMLVVRVAVFVFEFLVPMLMLMALRQVQPEAKAHQSARDR
jgi:hypothetical protein